MNALIELLASVDHFSLEQMMTPCSGRWCSL